MRIETMLRVCRRYYEAQRPTLERIEKKRATERRIMERWHAMGNHVYVPASKNHGRDSFGNPFHETD